MNSIFFKTTSGYIDNITRDGFTINLVNPLFSDENYKFWSYPYENYMTDDFKREFPEFYLYNKSKKTKKVDGQINIEGTVYDGVLEFISSDRNSIKKQIDFGARKLNFTDFNINELNYGEIDVENIYDYVDSVLDKTYPEINHCFPRVQTTEFEREENGNVINNCPIINDVYSSNNEEDIYSGLTNVAKIVRPFDEYEYKYLINIIKPYIFLLEILKKGFEKLGYNLEGDILNDDDFRFLCLDNEGISYDEFKFEEKREITTLSLPLDEEITKKIKLKTIGGGRLNIKYNANYSETYTDEYGTNTYNISSVDAEIKVKYKLGVTIVDEVINIDAFSSIAYTLFTAEIPLIFSFVEIEIEIKYTLKKYEEGYDYDNIEVQFNPIKQIGYQGNLEKDDEIKLMKNHLELKNFVPEISFSEILDFLKKYSYKIIPKGKSIYVNKMYLKNTQRKDFSFSEVKFPEIIANASDAKIIKLSSYDKLKYGKLTITNNGLLINSDKEFENKDDDIIINCLPLPFIELNKYNITYVNELTKKYVIKDLFNARVIKEEKDSGAEIRLIKYRGVFNKKNDGLDTSYLLPENAINTYFKNEIKFFHAENIKWTFISSSEEFKNLKEDDKIFAYKRELVIKNITKTFVGKDMYQIEFDTLSIL